MKPKVLYWCIVFKGLELNPRDCWSTHAEAHVIEMEGRQDDGISFLSKTLNDWTVNKLSVFLYAPSTLNRRNLKTEVSLWKRIKCFPSTLHRRNFKTRQSSVSLGLYFRETRPWTSHDYCDAIVLVKLRFRNVFLPYKNEKPPFSNSSGLKSVFEKPCLRDGLVWTVGHYM